MRKLLVAHRLLEAKERLANREPGPEPMQRLDSFKRSVW
jgi:hypothetical protein